MNYSVINFPDSLIKDILRNKDTELQSSSVNEKSGLIKRNSKVSWIKDTILCQRVFSVIKDKSADFSNSTTVTVSGLAAINPTTNVTATKNEFDVYINGQYIDKDLYHFRCMS